MSDPFAHRQPKSWLKVSIKVPSDQVDIVSSFLTDLTGAGVEESYSPAPTTAATTTITGYLEEDDNIGENQKKIRKFVAKLSPNREPTIHFEKLVEEDWGKNWKKHFKPVQITSRITIKPTWETFQAKEDQIVIEIDPGLAFGTGLHASTRLALQLIENAFSQGLSPETVLDVGTGTGILGIAAALFGAQKVVGIDNDPDAVVCAEGNIKQNSVDTIMAVSGQDLEELPGPYDLVVANITSDVLTELAPMLAKLLAPTGQLILAGILHGEQGQNIQTTYTALGLPLRETLVDGEWQAFRFAA